MKWPLLTRKLNPTLGNTQNMQNMHKMKNMLSYLDIYVLLYLVLCYSRCWCFIISLLFSYLDIFVLLYLALCCSQWRCFISAAEVILGSRSFSTLMAVRLTNSFPHSSVLRKAFPIFDLGLNFFRRLSHRCWFVKRVSYFYPIASQSNFLLPMHYGYIPISCLATAIFHNCFRSKYLDFTFTFDI